MNNLTSWYRRITRYSTLVLFVITVALGSYVWMNRTQVYYESYCETVDGVKYDQLFSNSYDCDMATVELLKREGKQCLKAGCRQVER